MGSNKIKVVSDAEKGGAKSVREVPGPTGTEAPDLTRRRLVRGAAAAAPVILTLRSGAALAQVSACYASPWIPDGFREPSGTCAAPLPGEPVADRFPVDGTTVTAATEPVPVESGLCDKDQIGYDVYDDIGHDDLCCPTLPTQTVLVTASSATSLSGCITPL